MNKTVYIVFECDTWGGNPDAKGVFDDLNCVEDMRQYLAEHRYTPDLKWNYSIHEFDLNEWT